MSRGRGREIWSGAVKGAGLRGGESGGKRGSRARNASEEEKESGGTRRESDLEVSEELLSAVSAVGGGE